jgi:23S rRNA (pseudouridine1915-N3)-methyltransferase
VRARSRADAPHAASALLIHIVARGRIGRGAEGELVERYLKRLSWPTRVTELADVGGRVPDPAGGMRTVVLDETGRDLSSRELAAALGRWRDDGVREARFLIGAADGHDSGTRDTADLLLSFGRATWPHMMARAMLAEQLWRASSILAGHPYHREG